MPIVLNERFTPERMEQIEETLRRLHASGQPKEFEISVDGLRAVPRTDDPELFSLYESYVGANTGNVQVNLYRGASRNCERYILYFRQQSQQGGLEGLGDIESHVQKAVARAKEEWDLAVIRKEKADLEQAVIELEKENEKLEDRIRQMEAAQSPLNGILGNVGSAFVESFVRRNPQMLSALPGGEALAGFIEQDNTRITQPTTESEVSFQPKSNGSLSEEQAFAVGFMDQLKSAFDKAQFDQVIFILNACAQEVNLIKPIIKTVQQHQDPQYAEVSI